jgi:hypothetical protein
VRHGATTWPLISIAQRAVVMAPNNDGPPRMCGPLFACAAAWRLGLGPTEGCRHKVDNKLDIIGRSPIN